MLAKYQKWSDSPEFREGLDAKRNGIGFHDCPYCFTHTQNSFDRAKLDAWFAGWYTTTPEPPKEQP